MHLKLDFPLMGDSGFPRRFLDKKNLDPMYVAECEVLGSNRVRKARSFENPGTIVSRRACRCTMCCIQHRRCVTG